MTQSPIYHQQNTLLRTSKIYFVFTLMENVTSILSFLKYRGHFDAAKLIGNDSICVEHTKYQFVSIFDKLEYFY